jgi:hypothetical protein
MHRLKSEVNWLAFTRRGLHVLVGRRKMTQCMIKMRAGVDLTSWWKFRNAEVVNEDGLEEVAQEPGAASEQGLEANVFTNRILQAKHYICSPTLPLLSPSYISLAIFRTL